MKKSALLLSVGLCLLGGYLFALPVVIYKIELAPGNNAYRYAAEKGWKVFYALDEQLLVSGSQSILPEPRIIGIQKIYQGDSKDLKWAYLRKGFSTVMPPSKTIFSHKGSFLLEAPDIKNLTAKGYEAFSIRDFSGEPIRLNANLFVLGKALDRDTTVASLTYLIDTTGVRADVESLQAFNTRSTVAPNHEEVAEWIRDEFISYGITDVVIDSFVDPGFTSYTQYYFSNSETYKIRNVIATIPGTLDTESVYIVGGHYDTSVWPYNPWAPGADDNGSGTTAVLQAARVLAANPPNTTVKFIAFDCEEWGLYGSGNYAAQAVGQGEKIQCMLNYDMIGSTGNDSILVSKIYPGSEGLAYLFGQMQTWYGRTSDTNLVPAYNSVYLNGSDSWEFYTRGYPVTYAEEYNFSPVYHMTNDSITYMNIRYCTSAIKAGLGLLATLANYPQRVSDVVAKDIGTGTDLSVQWSPNVVSNITGYNVYYGINSGVYTNNQYTKATSDTISGLTPNTKYYIAVRAVDGDGKESPVATEAEGMPVLLTLDQGILIVDETQNWTTGSFPRDTTQDQYYDSLLAGYTATKYEFGSSGQKPALSNMAAYSTIFWHSDDYSQTLMNPCIEDLKLYLGNGGQLVMAGWKPTADITSSTIDTMHYSSGSFMYDYMKVSQMNRSLSSDSFQGAFGKLSYPDIAVDPTKVPVASYGGTMRYAENLVPVSPAEGIYDIDMKNNGSLFEGLNCGVRYLGSDFKTALLGFPLYFMDQAQARVVVQKILDDFGEVNGVSGKPDNIILGHEFKLFQNAPNPFSKSTAISYHLPKTGKVSLNIYNINGQLVKTLVNSDQPAGRYTANWDRRDNQNKQVSAGVYIYRLSAGNQTLSKKLIVLK